MLNNEQFEEKTISRKEIYSGKIIDVAVDEVRLPSLPNVCWQRQP